MCVQCVARFGVTTAQRELNLGEKLRDFLGVKALGFQDLRAKAGQGA